MSHLNQGYPPQFNYNVHGPTEQYNSVSRSSYQGSNGSQQWSSMAPRSVQHSNIPSPSASVRSTATTPVSIVRSRPDHRLPGIGRVDDNIDPSLFAVGGYLAPIGHVSQVNYNIERSLRDGPWNPLSIASPTTGDGHTPLHQASANHRHYRQGPGSTGSVAAPVSDSGYNSQSVVSNDASRMNQSYINRSVGPHGTFEAPAAAAPAMARMLSDQRSQDGHLSSRSRQQTSELACSRCSAVMKCRSDLK